jgi:hypothetical protein
MTRLSSQWFMKLLHALMAASFLVILSLFEVQGDGGPQKEAEVVNPVAVNVFWRRRRPVAFVQG